MYPVKILSLFSGCGGLDLGFTSLNEHNNEKFKVVWANDFDLSACKTFSRNFGSKLLTNSSEYSDEEEEVIYFGDIRKVDFRKLNKKGKIDLILGGFPCQDFSILRGDRKEKGIKVKRGRLYLEFVRALIEIQPKVFVAENVQGLKSANNGLAYDRILKDFQNLYNWETFDENLHISKIRSVSKPTYGYEMLFNQVVDFSNLGVPQVRKRLILIGLRKDISKQIENIKIEKVKKKIAKDLLGKESLFSEFPLTPIEVFLGKPLSELNEYYKEIMESYAKIIEKVDSERKKYYVKSIWSKLNFNVKEDYFFFNNSQEVKNAYLYVDDGVLKATNKKYSWSYINKKHKELLSELDYTEAIEKREFDDGSNEIMKEEKHVIERMEHIPPGENWEFVKGTELQVKGLMSNVYKRLNPLKPSFTIIGKGGGGTWGYHYLINRQRLTHRERARLQTFPDWFMFEGKSSEIRAQIGNAVPPLGAKAIAKQVYKIFEIINDMENDK